MRFYALNKMLEAAELAARVGSKSEAVEHIRELQAHCEKMIGILAPDERWRPRLVPHEFRHEPGNAGGGEGLQGCGWRKCQIELAASPTVGPPSPINGD